MGKLIYAANISLDGFLEDETGSFDWSVPDEDVHAFWNEHERHMGTSLSGRRMYEAVLLLCPVLVGGGKPALPRGVRLNLELLDHGRFDNGVVYVRHAVRHPA